MTDGGGRQEERQQKQVMWEKLKTKTAQDEDMKRKSKRACEGALVALMKLGDSGCIQHNDVLYSHRLSNVKLACI